MSPALRDGESFRLPRAVLLAALAALALKLVLASTTQGTNDVRSFWYFLQEHRGWLVPWIADLGAGIGAGLALAWCLSSAAFLCLVYTFWCQGVPFERGDPNWLGANFWSRGLPWNFADANSLQEWR